MNYRLPLSQTIELTGQSNAVFATSTTATKQVRVIDLCSDFLTSATFARNVLFKSFKVIFAPINIYASGSQETNVLLQCYLIDINGSLIQATKQRWLNATSETVVNFSAPLWLQGANAVNSTTAVMAVILTSRLGVITTGSYSFTVVAQADISPDTPTLF